MIISEIIRHIRKHIITKYSSIYFLQFSINLFRVKKKMCNFAQSKIMMLM